MQTAGRNTLYYFLSSYINFNFTQMPSFVNNCNCYFVNNCNCFKSFLWFLVQKLIFQHPGRIRIRVLVLVRVRVRVRVGFGFPVYFLWATGFNPFIFVMFFSLIQHFLELGVRLLLRLSHYVREDLKTAFPWLTSSFIEAVIPICNSSRTKWSKSCTHLS